MRQQLIGALAGRAAAEAPEPRQHHEVLASREVFVERGELARHRDGRAHLIGARRQVVAHDARRTLVRVQQRGQHAHQRGLAGAVGTEDGEDHAARHVEVDAVDGAKITERLDEPARLNGGCNCCHYLSARTCPGTELCLNRATLVRARPAACIRAAWRPGARYRYRSAR